MKPFLLSILLIITVAGGVSAYQNGCPGQGHYQDFMSDLTPEQQGKVKELTDTHHEKLFALQKEIKERHAAMEALFAKAPVDKPAVDKAVADLSKLQAEKSKLNADYRVALTEITGKPLPLESDCGRGKGCGARTAPPCGAAKNVSGNTPDCPGTQQ